MENKGLLDTVTYGLLVSAALSSFWWLFIYSANTALMLIVLPRNGQSAYGQQISSSSRFDNLHWEQSQANIDSCIFGERDLSQQQGPMLYTQERNEDHRVNINRTIVKGDIRESDTEAKGQQTEGKTDDWPPWPTLKEDEIRTEEDRIYFKKYNILPKRSVDCDNMSLPSFDYTLVTALINLRREHWPRFKRQFIKYLYYAARMLDFHAPMVIYVDEEAVDFVRYHRQGKGHITQIIPVSLRDLEYYAYHDRIKRIMESDQFKEGHTLLHHPEGFSPDYNILMNSKLSMLYAASSRNAFRTRYFYWMDVGYGHGEDIYPKSCYWAPRSVMNDVHQITYIQLNPVRLLNSIDDLYKRFLPPFLNGAFFGGPVISIKRYYFLHREVFLEFLDQGKVDDDQTMAVACYFRSPLLFNLVEGWWYDAFALFS